MVTELRDGDRLPMSWEDYQDLPDTVRGEYIDGELVVSPSPTGHHQDIEFRLETLIAKALPAPVRVRHGWAWKPAVDEFIPDLMVFDATDEQPRLTALPHLVVEVLSTDRAADALRKFHKYAAAGLERYWIIDPDGPLVIVYRLSETGSYVEAGHHGPGEEVEFDIGVTTVTFDPGDLLRGSPTT